MVEQLPKLEIDRCTDGRVDAIYLRLKDGGHLTTWEAVKDKVFIDFGKNSEVLGIEVLPD